MLETVKKTSITQQVFEQFKAQILAGTWTVGEKLPAEKELAAALGVSRSTVRQALRSLSDYGLIESRLGSGSYVKKQESGVYMNSLLPTAYFQQKDLREALEFCCVFENDMAGLAAQRAEPQDVEELKRLQDKIETTENFAALDLEFHLKIAKITRNSIIIQTYTIVNELLGATMVEMYNILGSQAGIPYHRALIDAIEHKNSQRAKQVMEEHVNFRREAYLKHRAAETSQV